MLEKKQRGKEKGKGKRKKRSEKERKRNKFKSNTARPYLVVVACARLLPVHSSKTTTTIKKLFHSSIKGNDSY